MYLNLFEVERPPQKLDGCDRLRKEVAKLKMQRDILKKAAAYNA